MIIVKRKLNNMFRNKAQMMTLLGGFLAVAIIAGALTVRNREMKKDDNQYIDLNEQTEEIAELPTTAPEVVVNVRPTKPAVLPTETVPPTEAPSVEEETEAMKPVSGQAASALHFNEESKLTWPVEGNVVLDYSMDSTIYFPTLEQYKCNPSIVIQSDVNTPVKAPCDVKVIAVGENEELGKFVVAELGDDYQAKFGQLKEIDVSAGETVKAGEVLGYVAEPTKYYVVEGSNLNFSITKDGLAVDPLDYIQ